MNDKTKEIHIVELKCEIAKFKAYQLRILRALENIGVHIHSLRLFFNPKYWGNHFILGDPRYADKIILDSKEILYENLIQKFLEWHGMPSDMNVSNYLHPKAEPRALKVEDFK